MKNMRLKCAIDQQQMAERLKRSPELIELQLYEDDIEHPERIVKAIHYFKKHGVKVYLHHPTKYQGDFLDLLAEEKRLTDFYTYSTKVIAEICQQESIKCVVHAHYAGTRSSTIGTDQTVAMARAIETILKIDSKWLIWEDSIEGIFSAQNKGLIDEIVKPLNLPRVIDTSHTFIALNGDASAFEQTLSATAPYTVYFHLVDTLGVEHDSLELGQGRINWKTVKPYTENKEFIFEIGLDDFNDSTPMQRSADYYNRL